MVVQTLQDLYLRELRDLYGAEKLLLKWISRIMDSADAPELRQVLADHVNEVGDQVSRLESVFQSLRERAESKKPQILEGIIREADEDIADIGPPTLRDAAIVAAMQQIKHYEIASYGTLQAYAIHLGYGEAARILQGTLDEERAVDRKLTEIALNHLKMETTHAV